ncbi:unnamed protein product [Fraxinus pennsylvanica]|uniref:Uncharacterized protein n=1 Tax=Fraxinus pennsylvanica TaxID=56036 RepID=A0AAD2DP51_9LAMI|nr:unnamed protein product [Fraxinus pennsylvanica]
MGISRWDVSNDLMLSRRSKTKDGKHIYSGWDEYKEQLKEMSDMDEDYKGFMLDAFNDAEKSESHKRESGKHDYVHEDESGIVNDPQYELFLSRIKIHERYYILEGENNGVPMVIKYELPSNSEDGCTSNPRRETNNCTGKKNVFLHEKLILGDNCAAENQVQHEGKAPRAKKGKLQRLHDVQDRPSKKSNLERQHGTQINLRSTVKSSSAHEQAGSKNNQKKVDNKSSSDLEVTEIANLGMEGNSSSILLSNQLDKSHPGAYSEFRKQIINILREPYKKEEYDELRQAIEAQKAEGSKESSDLHEKLKKFEKERKKNLMERGFFFWLENKKMEGAFKPWKDPECAAVEQENCLLPPSPPPERRGRKVCNSFQTWDQP